MPDWILKLARRMLGLPDGRYSIIVTIGHKPDWTVTPLGKVEQ